MDYMQKRCYHCKLYFPETEDDYCARCGNGLLCLTFYERYRSVILIAGAVLIFAVVLGVASIADTPESKSVSSQQSAMYQTAIASYRDNLMAISPPGLILSVEGSGVVGVARVKVSNLWYDSRPHERRQLTQMLANLWSNEMNGESTILHIYDITGREIAGTKAFGGVWTEDE